LTGQHDLEDRRLAGRCAKARFQNIEIAAQLRLQDVAREHPPHSRARSAVAAAQVKASLGLQADEAGVNFLLRVQAPGLACQRRENRRRWR